MLYLFKYVRIKRSTQKVRELFYTLSTLLMNFTENLFITFSKTIIN